MSRRDYALVLLIFILMILPFSEKAFGFGNGGLSNDPSSPKYGTHDWFAEHALDFLPPEEKAYLLEFREVYLFGTELPDNSRPKAGLSDKPFHHVYYYSDGSPQDDVGARRAWSEFNRTVNYLNYNEWELAARHAGVMSHYLADMTVFGHVMDEETHWGAELKANHADYESYVGGWMSSYESSFNQVLSFDGELAEVNAYDATLSAANYTTFGDGAATRTCVWMDENYDWDDPVFSASANTSINRGVNLLADVLHTIFVRAYPGSGVPLNHIAISEVSYDTPGDDRLEEYVELYNPFAVSVDIGGWKIQDLGATYTIPEGSSMAPGSHFVLARDASGFWDLHDKDPDVAGLSVSMGNDGDYLRLLDAFDEEVDFVAWENEVSSWDIKAKESRVLERVPVFADSDSSADWVSNSFPSPMTQGDVVTLLDTDDDGDLDVSDTDDDDDGLLDEQEVELGTNPLVADTDGDGYVDSEDFYPLDRFRHSRESLLTSNESLAVGGVVAIVAGVYYYVRRRL